MQKNQRSGGLALLGKGAMASGKLAGILLVLGLVAGLHAAPALAQSSPSLDDLQKLRQSMQSNGSDSSSTQQNSTQNIILQPEGSRNQRLQTSRLERILSAKAGVKLKQFGYDQFGTGRPVTIPQAGAVQDNYVLGPGDEIVVSLRGQENSEYRATVDRNGQVALPRINPVSAAGRTLGEFRQDVQNAVARAYISTQAFVSVGRLRQIRVMVSGEVNNPGMRLVTGLSSPSDAILVSGGVKKTGSLRNIKLVHNGKTTTIDLYALLTQNGSSQPPLLNDGDRIIVPSLGKTVAVAGWVRRPAIYELPAGAAGMSVRGLLSLAGGLEVRGRYRLSVLRISRDGSSNMVALTGQSGTVRDSEVLFAQPAAQQTDQQAVLSGGTALAGQYSVSKNTTLGDILKSPGALGPSPYTLFGVISRRDPQTLMRSLVPFTPVSVLRGTENQNLRNGDIVRVLSTNEARLVSAVMDAFSQKREKAEEALRAPNMTTMEPVQQTQQNGQNGSGNQTDADNSNNQNMQVSQDTKPKTEREDIAELSVEKLGAGGVLTKGRRDQFGNQDRQDKFNISSQNTKQRDLSRYNQNDLGNQRSQLSDNQNSQPRSGDQYDDNGQFDQGRGRSRTPTPNLQQQDVEHGDVATNRDARTFGELAKQLNIDPLVLMHFLMDHQVAISGAVHGAGNYLAGPNATLQDLVDAAGGTSGWADKSGIEVTSTAVSQEAGSAHTSRQLLSLRAANLSSYIVKPHDQIRFNQVYTSIGAGSVVIQGEVRSPGKYKIEHGERLSELLLRAGGLSDQAYPYGTVFLRKSAAAIERQGYTRVANEMQNIIAAGLTRIGDEKTTPAAFTALQSFVTQLRNTKPLGRISIIADPVMLAANPARDPLLEAGDVIYIPQRPSTVTVLGQVMQSSSFQFSPKMSVSDYIQLAGGYGQFADKSLTFIVLPDGTARPVETSWLNLSSPDIPPGSTIVVPRDVAPIDIRQVLLDATSVLSQLAISAASLSVINR